MRHQASASMGPRLKSRGKAAFARQPAWHGLGFNGATAKEPWKGLIASFRRFFRNPASMGPRLKSRGKQVIRGHGDFPITRFNGATAKEPWPH